MKVNRQFLKIVQHFSSDNVPDLYSFQLNTLKLPLTSISSEQSLFVR